MEWDQGNDTDYEYGHPAAHNARDFLERAAADTAGDPEPRVGAGISVQPVVAVHPARAAGRVVRVHQGRDHRHVDHPRTRRLSMQQAVVKAVVVGEVGADGRRTARQKVVVEVYDAAPRIVHSQETVSDAAGTSTQKDNRTVAPCQG